MRYHRRGPIHDSLEKVNPEWSDIDGMPLAMRFGPLEREQAASKDLALADVSALPKLGVKGPEAVEWLRTQGIQVPTEVYASAAMPSASGLIVRVREDELFLEAGGGVETRLNALRLSLGRGAKGFRPVERQDAGLVLLGGRCVQVMAQTCGVDLRTAPDRLVMTRVAGVSCMLLPLARTPGFRIWCDACLGQYLWDTLLEIVQDLGGAPVGWQAVAETL